VDRVHGAVDRGQRRSTVDRGQRARCAGAGAHRCTGGSERRWLELIARAKEGAKELGREGMRCGEIRGVSSPFYKGRGSAGEGWSGGGVTVALMALTPLKTGARLRGGLRGGGK
jgi:hypothetical protein